MRKLIPRAILFALLLTTPGNFYLTGIGAPRTHFRGLPAVLFVHGGRIHPNPLTTQSFARNTEANDRVSKNCGSN